jgi:glycosyltransferase involved in cell wall biosynthesis
MAGISIALATYNGERFLPAQLDSLARQTKPPAELVVCDDCSTDRTVEIIEGFVTHAPFPVRLARNESRLGFVNNFMRAAQACESDLIAFCDQDDVWEPDKIEVMEPVFEDPEVLLAYHNATLTSARGAGMTRLYGGSRGVRVYEPLTRDPWLVIPGFMQIFRRELTAFSALHALSYDVDWPGNPLAHDRWFVFLASVLGRIAYVGEPLVQYRQHEDNVFGFYPDERARFDRLASGIKFIRAAVTAAKNRGELLRQMQSDMASAQRERSERGIAYYELMRKQLEARKTVYMGPTYRRRATALFTLLREGSYGRPSAGHFSWSDFLLDFYLAAPLGPRLRRILRK